MEGLGIELNGSLQEQVFWALSFTLPLTSQKVTLRLFKEKNVSRTSFSKGLRGNLEGVLQLVQKLTEVIGFQLVTAQSRIRTFVYARLSSVSLPCLCLHICICMIQHGRVHGLL